MLLNRLDVSPNAATREMRAYMAALLEVTGMMSGQGFDLRAVLGNIATHLKPKVGFPHATLCVAENGLVYTTPEGRDFFSSRLTDSPILAGQHVSRIEVIAMTKKILADKPPAGWRKVNAALQEER